MKLNKDTFWNKWYLKFNFKLPNNFCDYFWGSAKTLILLLILLSATILMTVCLLSPILLFWKDMDIKSDISIFQVLGMSFWLIIILIVTVWRIEVYDRNKPYIYKPYKESIIKTWYKAFKDKHCTLITWKD